MGGIRGGKNIIKNILDETNLEENISPGHMTKTEGVGPGEGADFGEGDLLINSRGGVEWGTFRRA